MSKWSVAEFFHLATLFVTFRGFAAPVNERMTTLIVWIILGATCGALIRRFGSQHNAGARPGAARWQRGAVYGAALGLAAYVVLGNAARPYTPPENIKPITEAEFESEVLQAGGPVVVDFYAPWCGPCKVLAPRLDALAGEFDDRIKFVSVNVDHAPGLAGRYQVQGIPTLLFFGADGTMAERIVGLASEQMLREKLEALADD
jgi:thioredoxin 1